MSDYAEEEARRNRFSEDGVCLYPCQSADDCFCWQEAEDE